MPRALSPCSTVSSRVAFLSRGFNSSPVDSRAGLPPLEDDYGHAQLRVSLNTKNPTLAVESAASGGQWLRIPLLTINLRHARH